MARKYKLVRYTDTSSGKLRQVTIRVPVEEKPPVERQRAPIAARTEKPPSAPTRGRAYVAPSAPPEVKPTRAQRHREAKRAKGQARVWAAEQALDPLALLLAPERKERAPEAIAPYLPGEAPSQRAAARRAERDEARRRRQAAKLGPLLLGKEEAKRYPVIGRDPTKFLVETMSPERRREVEERAVPRGVPKVRRTPTEHETQAAGFAGPIPVPGGGLFKEIWGDVGEITRGAYGAAADYGSALYGDIMEDDAAWGRTRGLVRRDLIGGLAQVEAAIPEAPSWVPNWMKKRRSASTPRRARSTSRTSASTTPSKSEWAGSAFARRGRRIP